MNNGAIQSKKDIRDYTISVSDAETFPVCFSLEMPKAKNQGKTNACVAYAITTIAEYHCRRYGDEMRDLSPSYVYGNRRETDWRWSGLHIRDALKTVCKYGIVTTEDFPYAGEVPMISDVFEYQFNNVFYKGIPNRFQSYYRVNNEREIKKSLTCHGPAIMSMEWHEGYRVSNGVLLTDSNYNDVGSSHAMVIFGWDERGWLVQNSHGERWGEDGRAVLPYDVPLTEAWGIVDEISEKRKEIEIQTLSEKNKKLELEADALLLEVETLYHLSEEIDDKKKEISDLYDKFEMALFEIERKNNEIEILHSQIVELKKPFSSCIGRIFARIINFLLK